MYIKVSIYMFIKIVEDIAAVLSQVSRFFRDKPSEINSFHLIESDLDCK